MKNIQKFSTAVLISVLLAFASSAKAQSVAIKTNMAGWAMMMPNLGVELVANERSSFEMNVYQSAADGWLKQVNATALQLGYRYWFSLEPMDGFFLGLTAAAAHYKAEINDLERKGLAVPAGVNFGYSWPMGRRMNFEISYGAGLTWIQEDVTYPAATRRRYDTQFTPTNIDITFLYLLR